MIQMPKLEIVATFNREAPIASLPSGKTIRQKVTEVGEIVKENPNTLWVKLEDGHIIKRHRFKHGVICMSEDLVNRLKKEPINAQKIV